jgi:hypothetical protein
MHETPFCRARRRVIVPGDAPLVGLGEPFLEGDFVTGARGNIN